MEKKRKLRAIQRTNTTGTSLYGEPFLLTLKKYDNAGMVATSHAKTLMLAVFKIAYRQGAADAVGHEVFVTGHARETAVRMKVMGTPNEDGGNNTEKKWTEKEIKEYIEQHF